MPLAAGQSLTHYEILGPLGAGGMGEVYRAKDTRLEREVAIKVLPEHFADDEERLQRFEREAKTLASLNHPNVAGVHGIDQVGDTCFIAMELVSGEDLATRLARGPLPPADSIDVCRQIAEGLEAAHEAGVVHRDLKPANVRITPDGVVKLLDFGLAKPIRPKADKEGTTAESDSFLVTEEGLVLGTPTYMSPEQARGKPVDRRTDVWAFGCVLYECLTGKRAFGGDSVTDVLAAIVEREPDWGALPTDTPASARRLLDRCLDKDPRRRLQSLGDARARLEFADLEQTEARPGGARLPALVLALVLGIALGIVLPIRNMGTKAGEGARPSLRLDLVVDEPLMDFGAYQRKLALSPDGTLLAYVTENAEGTGIRVRDLARREEWAVSTSHGSHTPFFSPDGEWIGFFIWGRLVKTPSSGGVVVPICEAGVTPRGATWGDDGTIVFASRAGLLSVPSSGGAAHPLSTNVEGERELWSPHFLPGSPDLLATSVSGPRDERKVEIALLSPETGRLREIAEGYDGRYVSSGHVVYQKDGVVFAMRMDRETFRTSGEPFPVSTRIATDGEGAISAGISRDGRLVYEPAGWVGEVALVWVDRHGAEVELVSPSGISPPTVPRLSPLGDRIAWHQFTSFDTVDIWTFDLSRESLSRETRSGSSIVPNWLPDGSRLVFAELIDRQVCTYVHEVGSDVPPALLFCDDIFLPGSLSPDGSVFLYSTLQSADVRSRPVAGGDPVPVLSTEYAERTPVFSPDGNWFAYGSDETGRSEIYVRRYPVDGRRWRISSDGGREPAWNPATAELFYREGERMMAVTFRITEANTFEADPPRELFRGPYLLDAHFLTNYDVDLDGQRFLMVRGREAEPGKLGVVTDWFDELAEAERAASAGG